MKEDIYFISDCHFRPSPDSSQAKARRLFIDFLAGIESRAAKLYLVGDIFDFWFEYKYVMPKHVFNILYELQKLANAGCEIHIIVGNHDYWMGDFFPNNGITVHYEDVELLYQDKKFLITHGDGKLGMDHWYPFVKGFLRNKIVTKLFSLLHPDLAYFIADCISRSDYSNDPDSNPALLKKYNNKMTQYSGNMFKEGYDYVVIGHYHYPKVFDQNGHRLINLGGWIKHFTYGHFSESELALESYLKK